MPKLDSQKILKLYNENNATALSDILINTTTKIISELIDDEILRNSDSTDSVDIIKAILFGCCLKSNDLSNIILTVIKHCLNLLKHPDVSTKVCTEIIGIVVLEIDHIPTSGMLKISDEIVQSIKQNQTGNGYILHVLPKLISNIQNAREVLTDNGSLSGNGYKKQLINKICSLKWSHQCTLHLAEMLKDIELDNDELSFIIQKILRQIRDVPNQEIPPLVYQLLNLTSVQYDEIVYGLTDVFDKKQKEVNSNDSEGLENDMDENAVHKTDSEMKKELCVVEGTVLLHLSNMAKLNISLVKAMIKRLKLNKESASAISSFFISCCLSMCTVKNYQDEIITLLKKMVFQCHQAQHSQEKSQWLRSRESPTFDIQQCFIDVTNFSKYGWDHLTEGLVQLGFVLMDSYGPKPTTFGRKIPENQIHTSAPEQKSCDTGIKILALTFKLHPITRLNIIERIFRKIVSEGNTTPVVHYIAVLHGICKKYAGIMLDTKNKIKGFLEHLHFLSPVNAKGVLRAIMPLIKINSNLQDSVILLLRKMLFSIDENSRIIAVDGFVLLLQNFKVSGQMSLSQASSQSTQSIFTISSQILVDGASSSFGSQHSQGSNNEPLCLEVLSSLRRCLIHQCTVREVLYNGIWTIISKNKGLGNPSLEVLLEHLLLYYEIDEDVLPPFNLEKCIKVKNDIPYCEENLPLLLSAISLSLNLLTGGKSVDELGEDGLIEESLYQKITDTFLGLAAKLEKCDVEDFELDKSADFGTKTNTGKKNGIIAEQVIGVYEFSIEYLVLYQEIDEDAANKILKLFQALKKCRNMIQSSRKDIANSTTFSPKFFVVFLESISAQNLGQGLKFLKNDEEFLKFVLDLALISCLKAKDTGNMLGISGKHRKTVRQSILKIASSCLKLFDSETNVKKANQIYIKIFNVCLQFTFTRNSLESLDFLKDVIVYDEINSDDSVVVTHLKYFRKQVQNIMEEDQSSENLKLLNLLIDTLTILFKGYIDSSNTSLDASMDKIPMYSSTPSPPHLLNSMNKWVGKFSKENEIDDNAACKALVQLHFDLIYAIGPWNPEDKNSKFESVSRDICRDIKGECGLIDKEDDSQESENMTTAVNGKHYAIITQSLVPHVIPVIIHHINIIVIETESILQRMKGNVNAHITEQKFLNVEKSSQDDEDEFHEKRRKMESSICPRLATILVAYQNLIKSALPIGNLVDTVLKGLCSIFNVLTKFTMYYIWLLSQSVVKAPPSRYESLIKLVGSEVTQYVYGFITHVESEQQQRTVRNASKLKKPESTGEKSRILRETRAIPPLIFAIETFERYVIMLGKKCKLNLMSGHHLPTSRDFRIKNDVIKNIINSTEKNDSDEDEEDDDEESSPKQPRL